MNHYADVRARSKYAYVDKIDEIIDDTIHKIAYHDMMKTLAELARTA